MSTTPEEQEKSRLRREIYAKMAQQTRRRRTRLGSIVELKTDRPKENDNGWRTGLDEIRHEESQFSYVEPYKKTFSAKVLQNLNSEQSTDRVCHLPNTRGSCTGNGGTDNTTGHHSSRMPNCKSDEVNTGKPLTNQRHPQKNFYIDKKYTSSICIGQLRRRYFNDYKVNDKLPIYSSRDYIINSINSYNVTIIEGGIGCGKTTQVPMYILEDVIFGNPQYDRRCPDIYVTQPRRIAARSIARRVCEEHNWELGTPVGYQVGLDKNISSQTVVTFCTPGVLLEKLVQDKTLLNYSHIIIDDAHERDSDTDLLMMMIKTLMHKEKSFFRLIIMSATMDINKLTNYFTCQLPFGHVGLSRPCICHVSSYKGVKPNLKLFYYDTFMTTFGLQEPMPEFDLDKPIIHESCYYAAAKIILEVIPRLDTYSLLTNSTIVFLPGLAEITKLHCLLHQMGCSQRINIIPLHSCLSNIDQHKVFEPLRSGLRKVILSTNIAETSITIKDVAFIIDFCLTKTLVKDPITRFPVLKLKWSTKDKCIQRAGRTGRCCEGKVFRLVPMLFYNQFVEYGKPELLTTPLELSILRIKNFQMCELKQLFALVLDPPPLREIRTAVLELKQVGCLSSTYEGILNDLDGDLTELGQIISILPIDVHLSKLIVFGELLNVLDDAIIIAATLSTNKTMIKHIFGDIYDTYNNKLNWSIGSSSDLFINLNIYKEYIFFKHELKKDNVWLESWCKSELLDEKKLDEVYALVNEIKIRLEHINIKSIEHHDVKKNDYDKIEDEIMLKIAISASFYPNYFASYQLNRDEVDKNLYSLESTKTIILDDLPISSVQLYCDQILFQLNKITKNIDYVCDNSRAMLIVNDNNMPISNTCTTSINGKFLLQKSDPIDRKVYMAIKFIKHNQLLIREYQYEAAEERMNYYKNHKSNIVTRNKHLQWLRMKIIRGRVADNNHLLNIPNEEYVNVTKNLSIEVEFNELQNTFDLHELHLLELKEISSGIAQIEESKRINKKGDIDIQFASIPQHHIFKKISKRLNNAYSPIQVSFYSFLKKTKGYNFDIDDLSINSIVLDSEYKDNGSLMLVAASVSQLNKSKKVLARDTTLMPKVPGLPSLMALLFAQYYKLVFNIKTNCLSGAIFGLGWDDNDNPIDKEYETEVDFDIHLTNFDIQLINESRRLISRLIRTIDSIDDSCAPRAGKQRRLKDLLLTIIRRERYKMKPANIGEYCDPADQLFIKDCPNVPKEQLEKLPFGETRVFLPIMELTKKFKELDMYLAIRQNLGELTRIQNYESKPPAEGIRCLLCGSGRGFFFQMQSKIVEHLRSNEHNDNKGTFEIYEQKANERKYAENTPHE